MPTIDQQKTLGTLQCRYIEAGGDNGYSYRHETLGIEMGNAALICVNLHNVLLPQTDSLRKRYTLEEMDRRDELAKNCIAPLIEAARLSGMTVVYTADSSPNIATNRSAVGEIYSKHLNLDPELDFRERRNDPNEYLVDAKASEYAPLIAPHPGDYYVRKSTYSGFYGTWMDRLLRNTDTSLIFLCGFDTECDILCTGLDSTALGYKTVLIREAIAATCGADYSANMTLNDRWVLHFEEAIGYSVTSGELCDHLSEYRT